MATLAELNIIFKTQGIPKVQTDIEKVRKEVVNSDREFKRFNTELRSFGRNMTQLGSTIRNTGLAITGTFAASFLSARESIAPVNNALNEITTSFGHMSDELARAAVPTLQEFSNTIQDVEVFMTRFVRENREFVNTVLKFGGFAAVLGTLIVTIGILAKNLTNILVLLKELGIVSSTLAASSIIPAFAKWAGAALAIYLATRKIREEIEKLADNRLKDVLKFVFMGPKDLAGMIGSGFKNKFGFGTDESPINLGSVSTSGGAQQLSPEQLQSSWTAVQASIENVKQKSQMVIENTLVMATAIRDAIGGVFVQLTSGIGDAVAASIVFGENLGQSLMNMLKNLAAEMISMLISVIAKIIILRSLGVVGPIPASALFGGGAGFGEAVGGSPGGKKLFGFLPGFADGGIVTKPTMGVIGEAGPEAVIPLDEMNSMGGGVTVHFNGHTFLDDESAIDKLVRKISSAQKRVTQRRTGGTSLAV